MLLFEHARVFFSRFLHFEELQDPNSSPRRIEVGRRTTLRGYRRLPTPIFYRARFQLCTLLFSQLQKLPLRSLQTLWEH
jgi:hypothetical protein